MRRPEIYGTFGAVFSILTWLAAIAAMIILGSVAGAVSEDRHEKAGRRRGGGAFVPSASKRARKIDVWQDWATYAEEILLLV